MSGKVQLLKMSFIVIIIQSTSAVGKRLQLQLPHVPPTQVPVGVDGLASLAEDRKNLFPDQVAQLLELRGNNSLLSLGR